MSDELSINVSLSTTYNLQFITHNLMLRKRQSRKIFVEITQTMFRKVQRTETSFV